MLRSCREQSIDSASEMKRRSFWQQCWWYRSLSRAPLSVDALGVPRAIQGLAFPLRTRAILERDMSSSRVRRSLVFCYFVGNKVVWLGNGRPSHKRGFLYVGADRPHPNKMLGRSDDLIPIDVGLVVSPGVINDVARLECVRGISFRSPFGVALLPACQRVKPFPFSLPYR